jgi:hypothetical protein
VYEQHPASRAPSEAPGQVEVLLENPRDAQREGVGTHGQTIEEITKLANELETLYKQSASRDTTDKKVAELAKTARQVRDREME